MNDSKPSPIYFSGLNGIRAMAAIGVVISHTTLALPEFGLDAFLFGAFNDGKPKGLLLAGFGVSMFFVLSGFLITYLLLKEKEVQEIDIKKFYLRRILRIWPLYYIYLALCLIFMIFSHQSIDTSALFFYLFYAANVPFILGNGIGLVAHYWSLGVEEQFYMFWPWFIKKVKDSWFIPITLAAIIFLVLAKLALHVLTPNSMLESAIHITRFHCMMIGALGAMLYYNKNNWFLLVFDNKITQLFAWVIILLVIFNKYHFASIIDNEIISVVTLVIIIGQINITNRLVNLENKLCDFLGKISYGIYVIHPLIITLLVKFLPAIQLPTVLKYLFIYGLVLCLTIVFSFLSYKYIESYFLKLKHKFTVVRSSAYKNG
jgi:peptidoglycan/LPS O-acetylase OafA/YrhL